MASGTSSHPCGSKSVINRGIVSVPEETNHSAQGLLKIVTRNVNISSDVKGVIASGSKHTGTVAVPDTSKWTDVFKHPSVNIKFNPRIHKLIGSESKREIKLNTTVQEFAKKERIIFIIRANIVERPRRKYQRKPEKETLAESKRTSTKRLSKNNATNQKTDCLKLAASRQKQNSETKSRTRKQYRNKESANAARKQLNSLSRQSSSSSTNNSSESHESPESPEPSNSQSLFLSEPISVLSPTSAFRTPLSPPSNPSARSQSKARKFIGRDETTQDGDVREEGEVDLSTGVHDYIKRHVSNRDMLQIREELIFLKNQKKFQSLTRLIPFTASFLNSVFVDVHQKWK